MPEGWRTRSTSGAWATMGPGPPTVPSARAPLKSARRSSCVAPRTGWPAFTAPWVDGWLAGVPSSPSISSISIPLPPVPVAKPPVLLLLLFDCCSWCCEDAWPLSISIPAAIALTQGRVERQDIFLTPNQNKRTENRTGLRDGGSKTRWGREELRRPDSNRRQPRTDQGVIVRVEAV